MLQNERKGKYLGETVRFSKQLVNLELDFITTAAALPIDGSNAEVCLVELGGSVGGAAECGDLGGFLDRKNSGTQVNPEIHGVFF